MQYIRLKEIIYSNVKEKNYIQIRTFEIITFLNIFFTTIF